jgi:protein SCO1/2
MRVTWLPIALAGVVAVAVGILLGRSFLSTTTAPEGAAVEIGGIYLTEPRQLEDFVLTDQDGRPLRPEDFKGHWNFCFFGYTFCPDVCPTTLGQLGAVESALAERGTADDTLFWMISVDPLRDTPTRLKEYVGFFSPRFRGASGESEQIDAFARQVGVYYKIHEPKPDTDYYLVDHSAAILLINPDGALQAVLTPPHTPAKIVEDFDKIRAAFRPRAS